MATKVGSSKGGGTTGLIVACVLKDTRDSCLDGKMGKMRVVVVVLGLLWRGNQGCWLCVWDFKGDEGVASWLAQHRGSKREGWTQVLPCN